MTKTDSHSGEQYKIEVIINASTKSGTSTKLHRVLGKFRSTVVFDGFYEDEHIKSGVDNADKACKESIDRYVNRHNMAVENVRKTLTDLGFK